MIVIYLLINTSIMNKFRLCRLDIIIFLFFALYKTSISKSIHCLWKKSFEAIWSTMGNHWWQYIENSDIYQEWYLLYFWWNRNGYFMNYQHRKSNKQRLCEVVTNAGFTIGILIKNIQLRALNKQWTTLVPKSIKIPRPCINFQEKS